jgi:hypothetical protein
MVIKEIKNVLAQISPITTSPKTVALKFAGPAPASDRAEVDLKEFSYFAGGHDLLVGDNLLHHTQSSASLSKRFPLESSFFNPLQYSTYLSIFFIIKNVQTVHIVTIMTISNNHLLVPNPYSVKVPFSNYRDDVQDDSGPTRLKVSPVDLFTAGECF